MRSMSPAGDEDEPEADPGFDPDLEYSSWQDDPRYERWPHGSHARRIRPPGAPEWTEDMDDPAHWPGGVYIPPLARRLYAMEDARPEGAREPYELRAPGYGGRTVFDDAEPVRSAPRPGTARSGSTPRPGRPSTSRSAGSR